MKRFVTCLFGLGLLVSSIGVGHEAFAQAPAAGDTKAQAKALFKAGRAHYANSNFGEALRAFEKANALRPHPLMLFNIAQVFESMDDLPNAITSYQAYLKSSPADASEVKKKISGMQRTLKDWPTVQVDSTPPGATVWLNARVGRPRGKTPVTFQLPPRKASLLIEASGYDAVRQPVELQAKAKTQIKVTLVKTLPTVRITTTPPGARVHLVGGETLPGQTPLIARLSAGEYTVKIELTGHDPVERTFTLAMTHTQDAPLQVSAEMVKATPKGQLMVVVNGPATVLIDGSPVGQTPLPGPLTLAEGMHQLKVVPKIGRVYEEVVNIQAAQQVTSTIEIESADVDGGINEHTVSYILMGVGGAALVGGGVMAFLANSTNGELDDCRKNSECERTVEEVDLADSVRSRALMTDILLGAGVAIAGGGLIMFLLSDDEPAGTAPQVGVIPTAEGAAAYGIFHF